MLRHSIVPTALLAITLSLAAGCGGGASSAGEASPPGSESALSDPTAEDAFAESLLLTSDDFPTGWVHLAYERDPREAAPEPSRPCIENQFPGQTGSAIGGEFSDENTTLLSINPSVFVFDGAASAQAAAEAIMSNVQCYADRVGDGMDVNETFAVGKTYTEALEAEALGATAAIRLYETQIYKSANSSDSDVLVFDIVVVVDGHILYEVDGFQRYWPIDQNLLKHYVDKAREKIGQHQ